MLAFITVDQALVLLLVIIAIVLLVDLLRSLFPPQPPKGD